MEVSHEGQELDFVVGFVIGALAGAAAAILMAPKSGEETRGFIKERGIVLRDQASQLSTETRRRAEAAAAQAKEKAGRLQTQVRQAIEEGRTKATEDLLARVDQSGSIPAEPAD